MCGIAALFGKTLVKADLDTLLAMTSIIKHRGPDDEGFVILGSSPAKIAVMGGPDTAHSNYTAHFAYSPQSGNCLPTPCMPNQALAALGHRRLSILDLSPAGHQPFCTPDRRYWITYNGEVYNYLEIRHQLELLGHAFTTQTDTEVILQAYVQWGVNCLPHFNGMFAFVIYDTVNHTLFAARDRFGVKPLYYWLSPLGYLALASEIKQFTPLRAWKANLEGQMAHDFLNWGVKNHTADTFFSGVKQIPGGHYLFLAIDQLDLSLIPVCWYTLSPVSFKGTEQEAAHHFHALLTDAVRLRLRADVPVGSCLSGGLDSSSIVCLIDCLRKQTQALEKQVTFTACSDVKRFDEKEHAVFVVNQTAAESFYTTPSLTDLFTIHPHLVWHQDEPIISTSQYAQWAVFKLVQQQGIKVVLDGQGADEQLAGYLGFFGNHFFDLLANLNWITLIKEMQAAKSFHPSLQPIALLFNKLTPSLAKQYIRKLCGKTTAYSGWFDLKLLKATSHDPLANDPHRTLYAQSLQQLYRSSLPMLLHYEDRSSMAHSIESRTPFLDYRLVEFTLGLPNAFKISNGWTKRVLRESMKGILPESIRLRKDKLGFVTAEEEWVKKTAPDLFRKAVKEALENSQGIIKPSVLIAVEEMIQGKRAFNFLIWRLISFSTWMKLFSVSVAK